VFNMFNFQDAIKDAGEFLKQLVILFKEIKELLEKIESDLQEIKEQIRKE